MINESEYLKYRELGTSKNKENMGGVCASFLLLVYACLKFLLIFGAFSPKSYSPSHREIAQASEKAVFINSVADLLLYTAIVMLLITIAYKLTAIYQVLEYSLVKEVHPEEPDAVKEETPTKPE